jgi:mannose-6-phosphate isomerase-like protein (cupin superfamily)
MKAISRRDLSIALSALLRAGTSTTTQRTLSNSEVLSPDRLPVATSRNGGKRWDILQGVLETGEAIAVHESLQPADMVPNPPHTIQHSELILVEEGTLLFEYDGRSEKVGPGGVILVALGTRHAARNVGDGPAKYLVVAIGGDTR